MKTIRLIVGSILVYLSVATLHACSSASSSSSLGTGGHSGSTTSGAGSPAGGGNPTAGGKGGTGGTATTSSGATASSGKAGSGGIMDPVGDANAEESGSRLKAKRLVGDDGSKQFVGWYDTSLKVDCQYALMQDGLKHCVPLTSASLALFSDAACTVPLGANTISGCVPTHAAVQTNAPPKCDGLGPGIVYHIYPITTLHTGSVYSKLNSICTLVGTGSTVGGTTL
jgi:hypothetical protein